VHVTKVDHARRGVIGRSADLARLKIGRPADSKIARAADDNRLAGS
jgi:hypothetical protein